MVEIRYGDQYEVSDLAGQTVCEARELFKTDLGIPNKAQARLNGSKVKPSAELDTVINDDDKLTFAVSRSRTPLLIGALLLALAVTGSLANADTLVKCYRMLAVKLVLCDSTNNLMDINEDGTINGDDYVLL